MDISAKCEWSDFYGDTFELHTSLECLNTNLTTVIYSSVANKSWQTHEEVRFLDGCSFV